jgi:hypothetical protein
MDGDGTYKEMLYGAHSHLVGSPDPTTGTPTDVQFVKARPMEDGRVMALIRPADPGTDFGGNLVILDVVNSVECTQRTLAAAGGVGSGPCPAMANATTNDVRTVPGPSPGGRFNSAYPLFDRTNRVLVSWTQCRLVDTTGTIVPCSSANLAVVPALQLAPPLYSIWLFDPADDTLKPVVTPVEGDMLTDVVALQAHPPPAYIPPVSTASRWPATAPAPCTTTPTTVPSPPPPRSAPPRRRIPSRRSPPRPPTCVPPGSCASRRRCRWETRT